MSISYISQDQTPYAVQANLSNKGFAAGHPTPGCTYVVQPPQDYHDIFQSLQKRILAEGLPIAPVRIPHSTVMLAKVIDQRPGQSWKDLEKVQKVYQSFLLYHLSQKNIKSIEDYRRASCEVVRGHEATLAIIASKTNEQDALACIDDIASREAAQKSLDDPSLRKFALESLNDISFSLKLKSVSLANNGAVAFHLSEDDQMLQMRIDLIVAGQGISKWPKLSVMKNGWSTVGYTIKLIDEQEKRKIDEVIESWVMENQDSLKALSVNFNADTLGCLAVRANDFYAVKRIDFPMGTGSWKRPSPISTQIKSEDLMMTPRAGEEGPTPIAGNRTIPVYKHESWQGPIHQEVIGGRNYNKSLNWKIPAAIVAIGISAIYFLKFAAYKK